EGVQQFASGLRDGIPIVLLGRAEPFACGVIRGDRFVRNPGDSHHPARRGDHQADDTKALEPQDRPLRLAKTTKMKPIEARAYRASVPRVTRGPARPLVDSARPPEAGEFGPEFPKRPAVGVEPVWASARSWPARFARPFARTSSTAPARA